MTVDEQFRAGPASVEFEFVGFSEADKYGEGDLGSTRGVIGILARGRHVVSGCERLCGPVL